MKIISKGNSKIKICKECGCTFEFDENDVIYSIVPSFSGTYVKLIVRCPECYEEIFIGK